MRNRRVRGQLWAFVFLAARRTLELVVLNFRSRESKESELLALRLYVLLFFIDLGRRRVWITEVTEHPKGA
jgi:hypothetical protein